jgi:Cu-Zn family superoxide dismutase
MSKKLAAVALFSAIVLLAAGPKPVTVQMKDAGGKDVGAAKISANGKAGVKIAFTGKGLPAGEHAFHFHAVAKCEGPAFTSAGGHFNPDMKKHGLQNPDGPHNGDMPNFTVKANGTAKVNIVNTKVTLGDGPNSLFTNGGTALMIHAKGDDMKSDPAGNAGDRIACGVITK